jgi:hypothetical protein
VKDGKEERRWLRCGVWSGDEALVGRSEYKIQLHTCVIPPNLLYTSTCTSSCAYM